MQNNIRYLLKKYGVWLSGVLFLTSFFLAASGCSKNAEPDRNAPAPQAEPAGQPKPDPATALEAACRDLIQQSQPMVDECRRLGRPKERVSIHGKALILDLESGKRRGANNYLPESLRGSPTDAELTLFLIVEKHKTLIATYADTKVKNDTTVAGYRVDVDLAVIRWPSKKTVGMVRVQGDNPPEFISIPQLAKSATPLPKAVTGWTDLTLSRWVAGLPAARSPDPIADALALAAAEKDDGEVTVINCELGARVKSVTGPPIPQLKRKILVWEVDHDRPAHTANKFLPKEVLGTLSDAELTLVLVYRTLVNQVPWGKDGQSVNGSGLAEGVVVLWPEKKVVGRFLLNCGNQIGFLDQGNFQADDEGQIAVDPERGIHHTVSLSLSRWAATLTDLK